MNQRHHDLHQASPAELKERIAAERTGAPFVLYRDAAGRQQILRLAKAPSPVTIGRAVGSDIRLDWDDQVSRVHAELGRVGDSWVLVDDGLSSNGSFVNEERVSSRRRLEDGDRIRVGSSVLVFRLPIPAPDEKTHLSDVAGSPATLSNAQRRVLVALCRPCKDRGSRAAPATNQQIAEELVVSVDAVKQHVRALAVKFGVSDLPQNSKRHRLVELAFQSGIVREDDL
jgi:predicted component of type VI protein secretion system